MDSDQKRLITLADVLGLKGSGAANLVGVDKPLRESVNTTMSVRFDKSSFVLSAGSGDKESIIGVRKAVITVTNSAICMRGRKSVRRKNGILRGAHEDEVHV